MTISLIAAMSDNRVIGYKNRIPWHIKEDLIRFKEKTLHHTVIMGRTTFESLLEYYKKSGKPLPVRKNIIVSRDPSYNAPYADCYIATSIEMALEKAKLIENEEIFICGGASIFQQTIDLADKLYLTIVHIDTEGDSFFPNYDAFKKELNREEHVSPDGLSFTFLDLTK